MKELEIQFLHEIIFLFHIKSNPKIIYNNFLKLSCYFPVMFEIFNKHGVNCEETEWQGKSCLASLQQCNNKAIKTIKD